MVRAPPCHGGGRGFESHPGRFGILAQLGEHLPYKQRVIGSSPIGPIANRHLPAWLNQIYANVAQLAEQLICNQQVIGSSPIVGSTSFIGIMDGFPSGQRGQTVNLLAPPSKVRILLHPYFSFAAVAEQADAQDLKSCGTYTPVPVRFRSAALKE